jgi:ribosomal protein S27E
LRVDTLHSFGISNVGFPWVAVYMRLTNYGRKHQPSNRRSTRWSASTNEAQYRVSSKCQMSSLNEPTWLITVTIGAIDYSDTRWMEWFTDKYSPNVWWGREEGPKLENRCDWVPGSLTILISISAIQQFSITFSRGLVISDDLTVYHLKPDDSEGNSTALNGSCDDNTCINACVVFLDAAYLLSCNLCRGIID